VLAKRPFSGWEAVGRPFVAPPCRRLVVSWEIDFTVSRGLLVHLS
jgi:hypothetical protein